MIPAQFLDIFGFPGFVIIFLIGLRIIRDKKLKYYGYVISLISLIGIIADGYSLIITFILK